ncbi:MAG: transposase, partial [bacterium]
WKHSGFSVDRSVRVHGADSAAIERLIQYMSRCPFSLERFVNISPDGQVFYRTENAECRPFAYENEDGETPHAVKRNFQHFKPLDFIADLTQHIPQPGEHLIRHYGWYANKTRGLREKKAAGAAPVGEAVALVAPPAAANRKKLRWAALIKRIYDADPLICPKCGGKMKLIAALNPRTNGATIEAILRHAGLWRDVPARAPPPTHRDAAGADQYRPASHPYPLGQPELFYIADGDGQGFRDDDRQPPFPDYD